MIPVISVVGKSNVGKTTLVEKLIKEIKARGYKVATVKHDVHGFDIDVPGKDTWRHAQAGSDVVVISSPQKLAMISKVEEELSLEQVCERISGVDLIMTEGYKREMKPKIEVFRKGVYDELLCSPNELIAIATDMEFDLGVPCYGLDDAQGLVDRIVELFLRSE
ncbi:MAG TPA: molybdopterin-guanine dinucleotide biosynthesis protein B [Candidatus Deferrimicrobium sp.]|nr:molybdopterin-guanine dinucleotide biosynthesis protein B [Candidatus Deferrimicrobium sp.]